MAEPQISLSRTALRRRPSMRALSSGGYEIAGKPENYAELAYGRGQHGSPEFGSPANDPRRPLNESTLNANAEAMNRATISQIEAEEGEERLRATERPTQQRFRPFDRSFRERAGQLQWGQSPWRNFFQALADKGVDQVQTGAAAGMERPGFFDTQSPSMAGLQDAAHLREIGRMDAFDVNRQASDTQNFRRRGY